MRNGIEKEIDLLNLLKHLLHSGTEEEKESDKDSYLAVVLLLRVKDPVSLICHRRAVKSAGCANGPDTNKCSNTTASIAAIFFFAHWSCYSAAFKDQFD